MLSGESTPPCLRSFSFILSGTTPDEVVTENMARYYGGGTGMNSDRSYLGFSASKKPSRKDSVFRYSIKTASQTECIDCKCKEHNCSVPLRVRLASASTGR